MRYTVDPYRILLGANKVRDHRYQFKKIITYLWFFSPVRRLNNNFGDVARLGRNQEIKKSTV